MKIDPLRLATLFHDTYERLAPSFGYETRPDTKRFDPESPNGKLMVATCASVLVLLGSTREGLKAQHGTPEEFERAVWEAYTQLFITKEEADEAIRKYRGEWADARNLEEVLK